jgi:hypothetical protein
MRKPSTIINKSSLKYIVPQRAADPYTKLKEFTFVNNREEDKKFLAPQSTKEKWKSYESNRKLFITRDTSLKLFIVS